MKTASKVFIVLSVISSILLIFAGVFYLGSGFLNSGADVNNALLLGMGIGYAIVGVFRLIIDIIGLNKLKRACDKSQLIGIGICVLIFCTLLGGVFMLCINNSELQKVEG